MSPIRPAKKTWRIRVDPIRCSGRGLCAEMLPELISLDDWGFPILSEEALDTSLLRHARRTVASCPELALFLEGATGRCDDFLPPAGQPEGDGRKVGAGGT
jgi:ferredoxin